MQWGVPVSPLAGAKQGSSLEDAKNHLSQLLSIWKKNGSTLRVPWTVDIMKSMSRNAMKEPYAHHLY